MMSRKRGVKRYVVKLEGPTQSFNNAKEKTKLGRGAGFTVMTLKEFIHL